MLNKKNKFNFKKLRDLVIVTSFLLLSVWFYGYKYFVANQPSLNQAEARVFGQEYVDASGSAYTVNSTGCNDGDELTLHFNEETEQMEYQCYDIDPNGFSFAGKNGEANTIVTSDIVQITGITSLALVKISGNSSSQFRICSDISCDTVVEDWGNTNKNIANNQYLQLKVTPTSSNLSINTAIEVGNISKTWYVNYFIATGGTVTYSGGYTIHTFTSSGTFTVTSQVASAQVETLIVAGGGSGGNHSTTNANGGGGGGGVIATTTTVTPQAYTVTVGNGGARIANATAGVGNNGQNSSFNSLVAIGGGGGGTTNGTNGQSGGSGGGKAESSSAAGNSTQTGGYGNAGGNGSTSWTGGGGGGAGSAGVNGNASGSIAGNGGTGYASSISGTLKYYGGGGGGGGNSSERAGDGFDGGGRGCGTTTYYSHATYTTEVNATTRGSGTPDAIPNTGGGGGAGSYWASNGGWSNGSGAGGSGIVIIRYPSL